MDRPSTPIIATLTSSRWAIARLHVIVAAIAVTGYFVYSSFIATDDAHKFAGLIGAAVFFVSFTHETWGAFLRPPRLRLYKEGLEISDLGFWPVGQFSALSSPDRLDISLHMNGKKPPKTTWSARSRTLKYIKDLDILYLGYEFPWSTATPSLPEFQKEAWRHIPELQPAERPTEKTVIRKTPFAFLRFLLADRSGQVTRKGVIITVVMLPICALLFFKMAMPSFFPSFAWYRLATIISWALVAMASLAYYIALARGKISLQQNLRRGQRWATLALIPMIMWCFFAIPITLSLPHLYTLAMGKPVSIERKAYLPQHYDSDHCIEVEGLKTGFLHEFCITREQYRKLPKTFSIEINGRVTWFGMVPKTYRLKPWTEQQIRDAIKNALEKSGDKYSTDAP